MIFDEVHYINDLERGESVCVAIVSGIVCENVITINNPNNLNK